VLARRCWPASFAGAQLANSREVGISSGNQALTRCALIGSNLPTRRHYFQALLPVCPSSSDQDPNCECRSRV
jgi:hypothetical protein